MSALPKFDLSSMTLKNDDDLKAAAKGSSDNSKFFKPGKHETKITKSTYTGLASDPTWGKYQIEMTGAGGKTIRDNILVPFKDPGLFMGKSGKNTTYPFRKLTNLLTALGESVTVASLPQTLPRLFSKDDAMVGLNVAVLCAYEGNHIKRSGDEIVIVDRDGNRLNSTPTFEEYVDANKYAAENKLEIEGFTNVTGYEQSTVSNKKTDANW